MGYSGLFRVIMGYSGLLWVIMGFCRTGYRMAFCVVKENISARTCQNQNQPMNKVFIAVKYNVFIAVKFSITRLSLES